MATTSLERLPAEVVQSIYNYVPPDELWNTVRLLNSRFHSIVTSRDYWIRRIRDQYKISLFPRIRQSTDITKLIRISAEIENSMQRFDDRDCLTDYLVHTRHISTPDAFHSRLVNGRRVLFTGARDQTIVIWDLETAAAERDLEKGIKCEFHAAHSGWIWGIESLDEHAFYSCGWDGRIKLWRYGHTAVMEDQFDARRAVLCLTGVDQVVYAGTYGGMLHAVDFRTHEKSVERVNKQCGSIIGIHHNSANSGNGILVGSEQGNVLLLDRRRLDENVIAKKLNNLRTFTFGANQLAASSKKALLLLDPDTLDVDLNLTEATGCAPFKCIPTEGGYFCADNFDIRFFTTGMNPRFVTQATFSNRITNLSYHNGDLVAGLGEGSIQVWLKEQITHGRLRDSPMEL